MKMKGKFQTISFIILLMLIGVSVGSKLGGVGGISGGQNNAEVESIGRFAVDEHNKEQNSVLKFVRVVKAKEQVVAGKMYLLTLEAVEGGEKKLYEAKVWVKPWENFKQLMEFKPSIMYSKHGN